jgi:hypothetical protein
MAIAFQKQGSFKFLLRKEATSVPRTAQSPLNSVYQRGTFVVTRYRRPALSSLASDFD